MRAVVMTAALVTGLASCAPRDPVSYAQMVCADQEGLSAGSDAYAACVQFVANNPPSALLALGGAMLGPLRAVPDSRVN